MSPQQVVNAFCQALNDEGIEAALRYIADDCVDQNMPFPPVHGPQGVRDTLLGLFAISGPLRIETLHQAAAGDYVFNARLDHFAPPGGRAFPLPVAGAFKVCGDKISEWRDYFCLRQFAAGTGLGL